VAGDVDLRALAEMTAPDRVFVSVFLAGPKSVEGLPKRFRDIRRVLRAEGDDDEREHFDQNVKLIEEHLKRNPLQAGSLCLFACWALDFLQAIPLSAKTPVADGVWIDSSPYIRPLAELQEEYENVAVVVADNKKARVFLVSSAVAGDEQTVTGNIKNHVKKGGWSQQRYERRRDKELLLYAREIADALARLDREASFRRVLLLGGKEVLRILGENLPKHLARRVDTKALDLGKGEQAVRDEMMALFTEQERRSEQDLWERIRAEYLREGLGTVGLDGVLEAAKAGRVEEMIVDRQYRPEGRRCRDCENLQTGSGAACSACGSASLFEVGMVNEIVELLNLTGAKVDFADPIPTLTDAGRIAALLRW